LGVFVFRYLNLLAAAVTLIVVLERFMHFRCAFFPMVVDSMLPVMAGAFYSNLTGKRYPNKLN
jgi:CBS domain-containing membrane protein